MISADLRDPLLRRQSVPVPLFPQGAFTPLSSYTGGTLLSSSLLAPVRQDPAPQGISLRDEVEVFQQRQQLNSFLEKQRIVTNAAIGPAEAAIAAQSALSGSASSSIPLPNARLSGLGESNRIFIAELAFRERLASQELTLASQRYLAKQHSLLNFVQQQERQAVSNLAAKAGFGNLQPRSAVLGPSLSENNSRAALALAPRDTGNLPRDNLEGANIPKGHTAKMNPLDVCAGKGRGSHESRPGNQLYKHLIMKYRTTYINEELRAKQRADLITNIMLAIQHKGAWFVEPDAPGSEAGVYMTMDRVRKKVSDDFKRAIRRLREPKHQERLAKGNSKS